MEEVLEDMIALSNKRYIHSIEEARKDYKEERVKDLADIFDV